MKNRLFNFFRKKPAPENLTKKQLLIKKYADVGIKEEKIWVSCVSLCTWSIKNECFFHVTTDTVDVLQDHKSHCLANMQRYDIDAIIVETISSKEIKNINKSNGIVVYDDEKMFKYKYLKNN